MENPKLKSVQIVLTVDLVASLHTESERRTLSMSAIVREALRAYLAKTEQG